VQELAVQGRLIRLDGLWDHWLCLSIKWGHLWMPLIKLLQCTNPQEARGLDHFGGSTLILPHLCLAWTCSMWLIIIHYQIYSYLIKNSHTDELTLYAWCLSIRVMPKINYSHIQNRQRIIYIVHGPNNFC
jgi:hypothetical protein